MLSRARGMARARPMRPPGRTVGTRASRQSEREPPALLPASRAFAMARAKRGVTTTGAAVFRLVIVPELFLQTGQFNGTCPHGHTPTRRVRPRDDERTTAPCGVRGRRRVGQSNAASGWCVRLVARAFFACDAKETKETKKQQK